MVPFASDRLRWEVDRLLAYVTFESDPYTARAFVDRLLNALPLKTISSEARSALHGQLQQIVDILERHRVLSLWRQLYEGSYAAIQAWDREQVTYLDESASILALLAKLEADHAVDPMRLHPLVPVCRKALLMVEGKDFQAGLLVCRWFVFKVLQWLLSGSVDGRAGSPDTPSEPKDDPLTRLREASLEFGTLPPGVPAMPQEAFWNPRAQHAHLVSEDVLKDALNEQTRSDELLRKSLEKSGRRMRERVEEIRQGLSEVASERSPLAAVATEIPIRVEEVSRDNVVRLRHDLSVPALSELTRKSRKLESSNRWALEDAGVEVDVQEAIQYRLSGTGRPLFRQPVLRASYRIAILIDRSGSMKSDTLSGGKFTCEEAAHTVASVLVRLFDAPGFSVDVYGYASDLPDDSVSIRVYRYPDRFQGSRLRNLSNGGTPTPYALRYVRHCLAAHQDVTRYLFLITDGDPTLYTADHYLIRDEYSQGLTRLEAVETTAAGIGLGVFLIARPSTKKTVTESAFQRMFGSAALMEVVTPDNLVDHVARSVFRIVNRSR